MLKYIQDLTKLYHLNCSISKKNNKNIILKKSHSRFIDKNSKKIGFPLTNKGIIGRLDGKDDSVLYKYVLNNLFDIENNIQNNSDYELILDFSKTNLGEYKINLKYNESLSRERKLLENKNSPYSENIMILFIDSVSRGNSMRQLTKTLNFFEKFIYFCILLSTQLNLYNSLFFLIIISYLFFYIKLAISFISISHKWKFSKTILWKYY